MSHETTFDFGSGPVPAHRHANGGGWIADTAQVYDTARVSDAARVYGTAQVYGAALVSDNDLICITGFKFHITISRQNAVIGCQLKTLAQWRRVTRAQAVELGLDAVDYARLKPLLLAAFKAVQP